MEVANAKRRSVKCVCRHTSMPMCHEHDDMHAHRDHAHVICVLVTCLIWTCFVFQKSPRDTSSPSEQFCAHSGRYVPQRGSNSS